jgi:hypothetical protein
MDYANATIEQLLDELEYLRGVLSVDSKIRWKEGARERVTQVRAEIIRRTKTAAQPAKE